MLKYKVDILRELKDAGINTTKLKVDGKLSQAAIQNIRRGEMVGIKSIDAICTYLKCQPGMVIEWVDEKELKKD